MRRLVTALACGSPRWYAPLCGLALAALLCAAAARGEAPAAAEAPAWTASAEAPPAAGPTGASARRAQRGSARSESAGESAQRSYQDARSALGLTALRLAAGVALVLAGAGLLTRWARQRANRRAGSAASIEVVAMRSLGPRHRVAVIETGGRRLLVGMASEHICTLLDLSETAEFDHTLGRELPAAAPESAAPLVSAIGRFEGLDG
jgi:flagellar biogenesis protein FliO